MGAPNVARYNLEFNGTIAGGGVWAWGIKFAASDNSTPSPADFSTNCAFLLTQALALWNARWNTMCSVDTVFTQLTTSFLPANSNAAALIDQRAAGFLPGASSGNGAASACAVVSLRTAQLGKSGRGRCYLPATGILGTADQIHGFSTSQITALAGDFRAFLVAVNGHSFLESNTLTPGVQSNTLTEFNPVTGVIVDARPDSQERRERHIAFSKATAVL